MSLEFATRVRQAFLTTWPEAPVYFKRVADAIKATGGVVEHPRTKIKRLVENVTEAWNHHFQHLTAVGAREAVYDVVRACYVDTASPLYGCRPVIFVHDEVIVEVPENRLHEAGHALAQSMASAMARWIPDIPIKAEPAAMRCWYKEAEPVYRDGKLVPWEPGP